MLLRPDGELNSIFGYWLGRAQARYPGISLYGVVAMSNHLHLVVRDGEAQEMFGQLSAFMWYFLGNFAKAVNRLRRRSRGPVFGRRFDSEPILDTQAAVDSLEYVISNPVRAGLVDRHEDWPGVLLYAESGTKRTSFRFFNYRAWKRAKAKAPSGSAVKKDLFMDCADLSVSAFPFPPPGDGLELLGGLHLLKLSPQGAELLEDLPDHALEAAPAVSASVAAVARARETEKECAAARAVQGRRSVGAAKVRAQDPFGVPANPKQSPRPTCHTSCPRLSRVFRSAWRLFRAWYAEASLVFRRGKHDVEFPPYAFRPQVDSLRPGLPLPAT